MICDDYRYRHYPFNNEIPLALILIMGVCALPFALVTIKYSKILFVFVEKQSDNE